MQQSGSPPLIENVSAQMSIRVIPRALWWVLLRYYLASVGGGVLLGGTALLFVTPESRAGIATVAFAVMMILGLVVVGHLCGSILFAKAPKWAFPIFSVVVALSPAAMYFVAGSCGVLGLACVLPIALAFFVQWSEPHAAR